MKLNYKDDNFPFWDFVNRYQSTITDKYLTEICYTLATLRKRWNFTLPCTLFSLSVRLLLGVKNNRGIKHQNWLISVLFNNIKIYIAF